MEALPGVSFLLLEAQHSIENDKLQIIDQEDYKRTKALTEEAQKLIQKLNTLFIPLVSQEVLSKFELYHKDYLHLFDVAKHL